MCCQLSIPRGSKTSVIKGRELLNKSSHRRSDLSPLRSSASASSAIAVTSHPEQVLQTSSRRFLRVSHLPIPCQATDLLQFLTTELERLNQTKLTQSQPKDDQNDDNNDDDDDDHYHGDDGIKNCTILGGNAFLGFHHASAAQEAFGLLINNGRLTYHNHRLVLRPA